MAPRRRPRGTGNVRQLRSGRWQVRYIDHDAVGRSAPSTTTVAWRSNPYVCPAGVGSVVVFVSGLRDLVRRRGVAASQSSSAAGRTLL
jgi:hypothetical protein